MPPGIRLEILVDDKGSPVVKQFNEAVGKVTDASSGATGATQRFGQSVDSLTGSMGKALTQGAALAAGFLGFQSAAATISAATTSILGFDKELANVNTVLVGSGVSIEALQKQILQLPPSLGSATELTRGLYQALSAEVNPGKAAAAGRSDPSTTAKVSTAAMDAFQLSVDQASHISDVLFTVVQRGKTEFGPLASSIAQVFPHAKDLKLSFEETAATVTTLTKVFPTVSEAITGFRSLLTNISAHMDDFRAAGINVSQVIGERGLTGLIEELARVTGQSGEVLKARFIPDVEGATAALALMGPQLQTQRNNVEAFQQVVGASGGAFEKQQQSISAALERIQISIERALLSSGLSVFFQGLLARVDGMAEPDEVARQIARRINGVERGTASR